MEPTPTDPVTALDVITLVLAIVALLVSAMSLGWQFIQHRLTGAVVKAELEFGLLKDGSAFTVPSLQSLGEVLRLNPGIGGVPVAVVRARNVGRLGVQIVGWSVVFDNDASLLGDKSLPGKETPHRLEPGEEATFLVSLFKLRILQSGFTEGTARKLRGAVRLGTGDEAKSPAVSLEGLKELPGGESTS